MANEALRHAMDAAHLTDDKLAAEVGVDGPSGGPGAVPARDPDSDVTRRREEVEDVPLTVSVRIRSSLAELEALRDVAGVEARFSDAHIAMSVFLFDRDAMVTPPRSSIGQRARTPPSRHSFGSPCRPRRT